MTRTHAICRRCHFGIPADAPLCPGCGRPAVEQWRRKARVHQKTVRRARRRSVPPLVQDGYRSLLTPATLARATLASATAVAVVTAAAMAALTFRVDEPVVVLDDTSIDLEPVARGLAGSLLLALAITGGFFVWWAVRAYRNLPALAIEERRYWTVWLIVGWVVPGANLFVPKLVVDDLWRASSPAAATDGGDSWQRRPVSSIVNRWWWSFLLTPAIAVIGVVTVRGGIEDFDRQVVAGAASVAAAMSITVAAVTARSMVAIVTIAQARRADMLADSRDAARRAGGHRSAVQSFGDWVEALR